MVIVLIIDRGVGIINAMDSKTLIKMLEARGYKLRATKGSHHVYVLPGKGGHISVPHPKSDLGVGLTHKLLKQAGLK